MVDNVKVSSLVEKAQKFLKCSVYPTLIGDESDTMLTILRNRESINRVLGKPITKTVSGAFRYYMAMCHLVYGKHSGELIEWGETLLLQSAQIGCADAWWELVTRAEEESHEKLEYTLRGYVLKQPQCVAQVAIDPEAILVKMMLFLPVCEDGGQFILHYVQIASDFGLSPYIKVIVMPQWTSMEIPGEDREVVEDLLRAVLLPEGDKLYAKIAEIYDLGEDFEGID